MELNLYGIWMSRKQRNEFWQDGVSFRDMGFKDLGFSEIELSKMGLRKNVNLTK